MWTEFPENGELLYHHNDPIPPIREEELGAAVPVTVHIASLGFSPDCSLKPAPGAEHFLQLTAQILQDGFVTAGEPLLVVQSRDGTLPTSRKLCSSGVEMEDSHWGHSPWAT